MKVNQETSSGILPADGDLTGHDRMARNVLWSWAGHLVFIIVGFIMPRLIDNQIGQFALGIWDFCWSLVAYLNVASLGVGSSTNRYVAKYRAAGDTLTLRRAISSVVAIQILVGIVMLVAVMVLVWYLPAWFGDRLGAYTEVTRWVVGLLGGSVVVQMWFDAFRGVITGCHRWDLHNGILSGSYALTAAVMAASLLLGGGLFSLAAIYFTSTVLTEVFRAMLAFRVCPELSIRLSYIRWTEGKKMLVFGGKSFLLGVPGLIVLQTINVAIVGALGPAALAVFSRPIGLVRHAETFLNKFSHIFTPMAGSLQGKNDVAGLRELLLNGAHYGVAFSLPLVLLLAVLGEALLTVWMGPAYAKGELIALMAVGMFLPMAQGPVVRVLMGLNVHGRIGLVGLVVSTAALIIGFGVIETIGWSLINATIIAVIPLLLVYGILLPAYACHHLKVPLWEYVRRAFLVPVLCGVPFILTLYANRFVFADSPLVLLLSGTLSGALVLGFLYWRYIVPLEYREKILRRLRSGRTTKTASKTDSA